MIKTEHLLNQVNGLLKSYEKLARSTGENFNIFSVMGMESNEVKTHSAIIGELLNPQGSHSQGSVFLKLFFAEIDELKSIENFDFDNAAVKVEEHIGQINEEYTKGGYIDIVIHDRHNVIVIENKIYAPDQQRQLLRYKNGYKDCKLIYLTLDGKKPPKESYYDLDEQINIEDIILVCYKNKILSWVESCHKESIQQPMLRETIKQYSNLLKKLTHQQTNNELKMDISELIKNNFLEASEIADNFAHTKNKIIDDFFFDTFKKIEENPINKELNIDYAGIFMHGKNFNFLISKKKELNHSYIYLRRDNNQIFYGITLKNLSYNKALIQNKKEMLPISLQMFRPGRTSVIFNDDFPVKIDGAKDVKEIIDERERKLNIAVDFMQKLLSDFTLYCERIDEYLTHNDS
jgi:hypothetical protein